MKGLLCQIYRSRLGNTFSRGLSSTTDEVILVGSGIPEIFEPTKHAPAVQIVGHNGYVFAVPFTPVPEDSGGYMAGGTFIYTYDGRFPSKRPIPLHDCPETVEETQADRQQSSGLN